MFRIALLIVFMPLVIPLGAQNTFDIYEDLAGDPFYSYATPIGFGYIGEYQWIYDENLHYWFGQEPFASAYKSWEIEVLSFPLVSNVPRTDASSTLTRILTLPTSFDPVINQWDGCFERHISGAVLGTSTGLGTDRYFMTMPANLSSQRFGSDGSGTCSERIKLPHTVLRHTLNLHCGESPDSEIVESISFIVDHTRGRMKFYPFEDNNYTSTEGLHDIIVQMNVDLASTLSETSNSLGTIDYFDPSGVCPTICNSNSTDWCNIPHDDCPTPTPYGPLDFGRPASYSLITHHLLGNKANMFAGYSVGSSGEFEHMGGIEHQYFIDQNIDLTIINPEEKVIYNPSEVSVEADNLIFPSGYTFKTIRGLYPTQAEVLAQGCNEADLEDVYVPTDLDASEYRLLAGSQLTIEPCVTLYDATIVVEPGAILNYHPNDIFGNFTIDNLGGTVNALASDEYCNNCACTQEYAFENGATINSMTTYKNGGTIRGEIVVNDILVLRDTEIRFADTDRTGVKTGIRVNPGGALVLDNAHLTAIECDGIWDGIMVLGLPDDDPVIEEDQGRIWAYNNSSISNARSAIYAGWFCPEGATCPDPEFYSGGILKLDDITFKNNINDIYFAEYDKTNYSYVNNGTFITTQLPDEVEAGKKIIEHIILDGKIGFDISNCNFDNTAITEFPFDKSGTGVTLLDAQASIDNSYFGLLNKGIDAYTIGGLDRHVTCTNSTFDGTIFGISIGNGRFDVITDNHFITPEVIETVSLSSDIVRPSYSVYLDAAQGSTLTGNVFNAIDEPALDATSYPFAVIYNNTDLPGGISRDNEFKYFSVAVQTEFYNPQLDLNCDDFEDQTFADYRLNPEEFILNLLPDFGSACAVGQTMGNTYSATGGTYSSIYQLEVDVAYYASNVTPNTLLIDENLEPGQYIICGGQSSFCEGSRMAGESGWLRNLELPANRLALVNREANWFGNSENRVNSEYYDPSMSLEYKTRKEAEFNEINRIMLGLKQSGRSVKDLNQQEIAQITALSSKDVISHEQARSILARAQNIRFDRFPQQKEAQQEIEESNAFVSCKVEVFPNPSDGNFQIRNMEQTQIELMDVQGRLVLSTQEYSNTVRDLTQGIYFLRVNQGDEICTQKIVVH